MICQHYFVFHVQLAMTDTVVSRNYFGRQVQSFEADLPISHPDLLQQKSSKREYVRGVFIRAPAVVEVRYSILN